MTRSDKLDPAPEGAMPVAAASRLLAPAALLTLLWFVLTGGAASSWIVGAPTIAAALLLRRRLRHATTQPWHIDPAAMLRLAIYFVRESVRGGIDVAGRVAARRPRVSPGFVRYRWRLPSRSPARTMFVLCVSLLPGTLVAAVGEHEVLIHALDATSPVADELAALEQRVADAFALHLSGPEAADD